MIERLIAFSIRHRAAVVAAGVALALLGLYAAYTTPVDAIPDLSENQVVVFTEWPGHSPREVEDQIGFPLSGHLQGIRGVRAVRSSSDFHFSMIHVVFEDDVAFPVARRRVIERLAQSGKILPDGVSPHPPPDALATGQIYWYTIEGGGLDLGRLRNLQDSYVGPQLAAVPGVAEVASAGGYPIEYQVIVDPRRLRTRGVTLSDVVRAVDESNTNVGGPIIHRGTPSTSSAASAGSAPEPGATTTRSTRSARCATSKPRCSPRTPTARSSASATSPPWPSAPAPGAGSWRRTATRSSAGWS